MAWTVWWVANRFIHLHLSCRRVTRVPASGLRPGWQWHWLAPLAWCYECCVPCASGKGSGEARHTLLRRAASWYDSWLAGARGRGEADGRRHCEGVLGGGDRGLELLLERGVAPARLLHLPQPECERLLRLGKLRLLREG